MDIYEFIYIFIYEVLELKEDEVLVYQDNA